MDNVKCNTVFTYSETKTRKLRNMLLKILQVVPNLYELLYLLNTKEDILKNTGNSTVHGPH